MNRREFLFSAGAAALLTGCKTSEWFGSPDLRFGVVSDIHLTTPKSARLFERALRFFKRRGVDAVVVPGDLSDWGVRSSLLLCKSVWDRVFAGTDVVPLFCTGNHDYDGWMYEDMAADMVANGGSAADAIVKNGGMAKCWNEVFGEDFARIRCRTVKGYDFVSGEWEGYAQLGDWMMANGSRFRGDRPFFYFQHLPLAGTTSDSFGWADEGRNKPVLSNYPNCIAFTGHAHVPFIDERLIWQGGFTAVAVPSLSYACLPKSYENGEAKRDGSSKLAMPMEPARRDLRGGQGYLVNVWSDRVEIERWDLEEEDSDSPAWVVPLPACRAGSPLADDVRRQREPVPEFPAGSELDLETRNTENRQGKWAIVLNCEFPSARMPVGSRVLDYEIRVVPKDGSAPLVKRFVSPAYAKMARFEPARQRFWIDTAELPKNVAFAVEVRARNSFGCAGEPLVSEFPSALHASGANR